jgi:hypothetical protein
MGAEPVFQSPSNDTPRKESVSMPVMQPTVHSNLVLLAAERAVFHAA